jgi:hypothetical protein
MKSWGSSVSTVSDYTLDDQAIEFRSPAEEIYPLACVRTTSEAHPAFYPNGYRESFPRGKERSGVTLTTHPNKCSDKNKW